MSPEMIEKYALIGRKIGLPQKIIIQIEKLKTPMSTHMGTKVAPVQAVGEFNIDMTDKLDLEQAKDIIRKLMAKIDECKMKPETNNPAVKQEAKSLADVLVSKTGITI